MSATSQAGALKTFIGMQGGDLITGSSQDCTPIAERAKAIHNSGYEGPSKDMKWAGSVPDVLIEKYCNTAGITLHEFSRSQEHKKRLLTDPDNAAFRIWKGAV